MGSGLLLDAHDPSSWPRAVKLAGVGNRIIRLGAGRPPPIRTAWAIVALPVASVFWVVGGTWLRVPRARARARQR
jgi:hypothetical protein